MSADPTLDMFGVSERVDNSPGHRPTGASLIAFVFVMICFLAVMSLHALRGDIDPIRRVMSEYANGSHGLLMTVTFYAFGVSAVALGIRIRSGIARRGITRSIPLLLVAAGAGLVVAGLFEVERPFIPDTIEEVIHSNASIAAFVMLISAMGLFSYACREDPRWWSFRWRSTILTIVAALTASATPFTADSGLSGLVQRLLAGSILVWFLLVVVHVRKKSFETG